MADNDIDIWLSDIYLLCVTCREPIRARISTANWIRVEWISGDGECQRCHKLGKERKDETNVRLLNQS